MLLREMERLKVARSLPTLLLASQMVRPFHLFPSFMVCLAIFEHSMTTAMPLIFSLSLTLI